VRQRQLVAYPASDDETVRARVGSGTTAGRRRQLLDQGAYADRPDQLWTAACALPQITVGSLLRPVRERTHMPRSGSSAPAAVRASALLATIIP
jgi:hypothetical protein